MLKLINNEIESISSGEWPLGKYSFDEDSIEKWNGEIIGTHWISEYNIDDFENHQTRAKDYDKGHVQELKIQIIADDLHEAVIGEITSEGKVKILSGHHRVKALIEISREKGEEFALIPFLLVSFENPHDKSFWKQIENKHDAVKRHGKEDAIKFLTDLRSDGYKDWDTRTDEKAIQKEAYEALSEAGYPYVGKYKKEIYVQAFNDLKERDTIKAIKASDANRDSKVLFDQDADRWENNKYVIASSLDASRKCLMIAQLARAEAIVSGKVNMVTGDLGEVKMLVYVPSAWKNKKFLVSQRKNYLEKLRNYNILAEKAFNMLVTEVVFPPQFRGKSKTETEQSHQKFAWDFRRKKFIKQ